MDFAGNGIKSELLLLFLIMAGTIMGQALHPSGVTSSDIQRAGAPLVEGKCRLKDIVTVFVTIDGSGCNRSSKRADNLNHYLIIVENRCKYCNAKGVSVQVSGYFLGNEVVNLARPFAPGGDKYVLRYNNSNEVGGVSPTNATFYECRDL